MVKGEGSGRVERGPRAALPVILIRRTSQRRRSVRMMSTNYHCCARTKKKKISFISSRVLVSSFNLFLSIEILLFRFLFRPR